MTTTKLTYEEFKTKRQNWNTEYKAKNEWASDLNESTTKLAYNMYLNGRIPQFAK